MKKKHSGYGRGSVNASVGPISVSVPEDKVTGTISLNVLMWGVLGIGTVYVGSMYFRPIFRHNSTIKLEKLKHKQAKDLIKYKAEMTPTRVDQVEDDDAPTFKQPEVSDFNDDVYGGTDDAENVFLGKTCLVRGSRNIIYGAQKTNKTSLAISIAQSIVSGEDYGLRFGLEGKTFDGPVKVLYYDAEMQKNDHKKRYNKSGMNFKGIIRLHDFNFTVDGFIEDLSCRARSSDKDLLAMLDNGTKGFGHISEAEVNKLDSKLKAIQKEMNERGLALTFILILHTTKDKETLTGSGFYRNFFECMIRLSKNKQIHGQYRQVTFDDCRFFEDGRSYIIKKHPDCLLFSYDPIKTKDLFPDDYEADEPKLSITDETFKEILSFHQSGVEGHGWGPTFQAIGKKHFNSQSTMIREVRKWEEAQQ